MDIQGVIFDMDGLLLDTEKLFNHFWRQAAKQYGYVMTYENALQLRSINSTLAVERLEKMFGKGFPYEQVKAKRCELMEAFIEKNGVEKKSGAEELLKYLKHKGYRLAVATSSNKSRALKYLARVGLSVYFDQIICGDEIKKGKPDPEIFLSAAEKLEILADKCLALEDSPSGIMAAHRAGCIPVMVPDLDEPDAQTESMVWAKADSLHQVITLLEINDATKAKA